MKTIRITMLLLLCVMLVVSAPLAAFAAPSNGVLRYGRTILQGMPKSDDLLCVYDRLVENCGKAESTIDFSDVSIGLTNTQIHEAFEAFHSDYPEYFWVPGEYSTISRNNALVSMTVTYSMTGSKLSAAKTAIEKKVKELTADLGGKSDYEKSLLLHDRLAKTTAYVEGPNNQNAYGALVEGEAWCTGYAKAYQYLLLEAGIPAWIVLGSSVNPSTGVETAHAWNVAKVGGDWYYTDVTWDDQGENLYHAYFNLSSNYMAEKHKASSFKNNLPKATATAANYFYKNDSTYQKFDADRIADALKAGDNTASMFVTGDVNNVKTFYNTLNSVASIKTIVSKMGVPAGSGFSYSLRTIGHEIRLTIKVIAKDHKHKLSTKQPVAPTCKATGHQGYYYCSCGKWFSDTKAQNEITDKDALIIPALAHKASGWKSNAAEHWKECTNKDCGTEIANTRSAHKDNNKDNACDTCGAKLKVAAATTTTQKKTDTAPSGNKTTATTTKADGFAATTTTAMGDTTSTDGNSDVQSQEENDSPVDEPGTESDDNASQPDSDSEADPTLPADASPIKTIVVVAGTAVLAGGLGVGVFLLIKRR